MSAHDVILVNRHGEVAHGTRVYSAAPTLQVLRIRLTVKTVRFAMENGDVLSLHTGMRKGAILVYFDQPCDEPRFQKDINFGGVVSRDFCIINMKNCFGITVDTCQGLCNRFLDAMLLPIMRGGGLHTLSTKSGSAINFRDYKTCAVMFFEVQARDMPFITKHIRSDHPVQGMEYQYSKSFDGILCLVAASAHGFAYFQLCLEIASPSCSIIHLLLSGEFNFDKVVRCFKTNMQNMPELIPYFNKESHPNVSQQRFILWDKLVGCKHTMQSMLASGHTHHCVAAKEIMKRGKISLNNMYSLPPPGAYLGAAYPPSLQLTNPNINPMQIGYSSCVREVPMLDLTQSAEVVVSPVQMSPKVSKVQPMPKVLVDQETQTEKQKATDLITEGEKLFTERMDEIAALKNIISKSADASVLLLEKVKDIASAQEKSDEDDKFPVAARVPSKTIQKEEDC